jgi:hypothetical protein
MQHSVIAGNSSMMIAEETAVVETADPMVPRAHLRQNSTPESITA